MYSAKVLLDSESPCGKRLTTLEVTFPRIVLAEFNTHRQFSRNSASSRAIPVWKMIDRVETAPFTPERFPVNQKGMQATEYIGPDDSRYTKCLGVWRNAVDDALLRARELTDIGVHKQIVNRLLEPFMWHTVIVSATEWSNFFAQRCHPDAQPEINKIATMMKETMEMSVPKFLPKGEWHMPLLRPEDDSLTWSEKIQVSVARCARVSYLSHDGVRDVEADINLYHKLAVGSHMSPFEHVAMARSKAKKSGNFIGWKQFRKTIAGECR